MSETFPFKDDRAPDSGPDPGSSLQDVFKNAPIGIFTSTPEGRFLAANPAAAKMFGFETPRDLLDSITDIAAQLYVDPRDREEFKAVLEAEGEVLDQEIRMLRKNGTMLWVSRSARVLRDRDGRIRAYQGFITDISQRKQAEEALKNEQVRRRILVDQSRDGIVVLNRDGGVHETNKRFAEMLGHTPEEVLQLHAWDWDTQWTREQLQKMIQDVDFAGDHFETRHRRKDGSFYEVEISTNGAVINGKKLVFCVCRDITERKKSEERLRNEKAALKAIIDNIPVMITRYDPGAQILYLNKEFEKKIGWRTEEVKNIDLMEKAYPDPVYRRNAREYMEKATVEWKEFTVRTKSGEPVVSEWSNIRLDDGTRIGIGIDVTERKKAAETLRRSENLFRKVFEILPIGLWIADKNGKLMQGNPAGVAIWGAEPHVDQEKYGVFKARRLPSGEEIAPNDWALARTVNSGETIVDELLEIDAFDGKKKIILNYTAPVLDENGKIEAAIIVNQDVTSRYLAEEALLTAKEQAEAANRAKSEFLANMSHEIRTPINGIMGMLQLLKTTKLDAKQHRYIQLATGSAERLTRLLSDILDLSRVEARKMEIHESTFRLDELQDSITGLFTVTAQSKGIALECTVDPAIPPRLVGDEARVRQILFNLVGNALKFSDAGKITVEMVPIRSWKPEAVRILFAVTDTGIGIPENKLKDLFQPFTQVDGSYTRKHQGAGLGLAIVKRLVELMDGHLCVESREGEGTSVHFALYFRLPDDAATREAPTSPTSASPGLRILLAEDDPSNALPTRLLLEKSGHIVTLAEDGQQALDLLKSLDFDVILMDIQMPVMNGIQATGAIRSSTDLGPKKDIPIIALTAYAMTGDREKFLEAGMNAYLAKPVKMKDLGKALEKIIGRPA
ncbi:PAS domain S-box-containing protein [Desulfonatronum zhilinae]|nr:PAS domain S-box-containing protein [Desulfonatronum zhilinae]